MSWYNKVVWSEGLFLRPQLFQQQERYLEHFAHKRAAALSPFFWGFHHFAIDTEALALGKLVVSGAAGIFQDGTPFDAPAHARLPAPLALQHEHLNQRIYLAAPIRAPNAEETAFEDAADSLARYRSFEEELLDANSIGQGPKLVQLADLRLRLLPEKELTESWIGLPLAKVTEIRADGSARLESSMIPPVNVYTASALLTTWLGEIHGLLHLRANAMAERLAASSMRGGDAAEVSEYLILQLLNRYEPILTHRMHAKAASPEALYVELTALAGELSTFVRTATRRPSTYDPYRHDEPHTCIRPVVDDLRFLLNVVLERSAQRIDLRKQAHGIRLAVLAPTEFERFSTFVLAVGAQMPPDVLQQQFPAQAKAGPSERLSELVRSHLPGIPLQPMPVPPRQIPFNAGQVYFELSQNHPLWEQVQRYGGLALHVAGHFPEIRLELWGVRS
ncbi:type VI secretion system baseplate subunit TssK [Cupriavidus basilensis]|uniref:type VI secretion system baseplate subunit TssK n=1 Tax=Cupriavidus basilensis TaxID=68895 RepID=UPI00157A72BF|nr:type VI secretion system baseplate subunit TssK [Cupriavidus basilensis]NUA32017.1 type VI secretion system baseplate subunit TssK [Cupriavidus basilensis]